MSELKKLKFQTISNTGLLEGMSNQCMFISIYHYLKFVLNIEHVTVREIREIGGLDADTERTMYDYNDARYANCLDKICSHYSIQIKIYYVNHEHDKTQWLGKNQFIFGAKNDRKVRIAAYGNHFELINKIGTTEFFNKDIITVSPTSISSKTISDLKQTSSDLKDTSSDSQDSSSDMVIEALVVTSVELSKDVEVIRGKINKLILEINELDKRFGEKKSIYKKTYDSDVKKKIRTELEVIKKLGETKKQLVLNYKSELDKLKNMINENMNDTHKLEISH